ncbi:MAG: SIS domain-containing protein [Syntrophobacterales bacterium]|nr:SIS domain-containing protein [Syntrophobacterales bacterium]
MIIKFKKIISFSHKIWNILSEWRVFTGRNPRYLPPKSIILFPFVPETLFCGLAGILTIKREIPEKNDDIIKGLYRRFEKIKASDMEKLLAGHVSPNEYLAGGEALADMEKYILDLKQDSFSENIFFQAGAAEELASLSKSISSFLLKEEELIEKNAGNFSTEVMEQINNSLIRLKDSSWALDCDILSNIERIIYLSGCGERSEISHAGFKKYRNLNLLLNSIDRLEVRGRDSAGVQVTLTLKDRMVLDKVIECLKEKGLYADFKNRLNPGDLLNDSIHLSDKTSENGFVSVAFTYKRASVTGKLGENTGYLRNRIRSDQVFQTVINEDVESQMYLAHTRWASVGSITEENCHPVNNFTSDTGIDTSRELPLSLKEYPYYGKGDWSVNAALNGDIDNYKTLRLSLETDGSDIIDQRVTTDTKIIPLQIEKYLYEGHDLRESFRLALNDFEGSHAIAMESNLEPGKVFLALRGSGQSLYIGLGNEQYMFASEVYGLVEQTPYFIKMNGENERIEGNPRTKGQIFILSEDPENTLEGIDAFYYDGHPLDITEEKVQRAEITTRDIDRRNYPHFLFKEIMEAPFSAEKTLRGKYLISRNEDDSAPRVLFNLGNDIIPGRIKNALGSGAIRNIFVTGQGTAAVAGAAIAEAFSRYLKGAEINIQAKSSSELSGFFLEENMSHVLVVAVTQSGTTADTNRAVAMAKERGAHLIAIVNRRQSDITHVADGVFYTSDGRDIEMSVASTKAFYSQIVAGYVLALCFAQMLGAMSDDLIAPELLNLEDVPDKMNSVIAIKEKIRNSAWDIVKKKKYWAVVGSGPNKVAADEIRIKLSELCYKTISSDTVENKKHIDLSAEPLIIVCAAGNPGPVVEDIVKDAAIFKAHSAGVVVIADEGETRFDDIADSVIPVPGSTYPASVVLNTLAGHIWGYYAACSINEDGDFFRSFRNKLSRKMSELEKKDDLIFERMADAGLHKLVEEFSSAFRSRRNRGFFSSMSNDATSDITLLLKYVAGKLPLEDFWEEFKEKRTSSSPLDMLDVCLGRAIDELSRPIDAIRHQAKTVTVGTSRKGEIPRGILFDLLSKLGFSLENLTSKEGFTAGRLQGVISGTKGYTLYNIENLDDEGKPRDASTISIEKRGGIALQMKSRVGKHALLKGTKKSIVSTGEIYAGLGKFDKAPIVIVPLLGEDHSIKNILLVHVRFKEDLSVSEKKAVLGDKFNNIRDLINECDLPWDDNYLEGLSVEFLLGESADVISSRIMKFLKEN